MGLFGGFKAKFTRNSKDKGSSDEVVCLKYHTLSEFEQNQRFNEIPASINKILSERHAVRKTEVIKKPSVKPRKSILTNGSFLDKTGTSKPIVNNTSKSFNANDDLHKPQKSQSSNNVYEISTKTPTHDGKIITKATSMKIIEQQNVPPKRISFGSRKNSVKKEETKIVETSTNNNVIQSRYVEKSVLIAMVQKSDDSESDTELPPPLPATKPPTVLPRTVFSSQLSSVSNNSSIKSTEPTPIVTFGSDDETASVKSDEFKITIVKHDTKYLEEDYSEDETQAEDEIDLPDMDFSSQAASIFFGGGGDEHAFTRPRKFNLGYDDEDEERRTSVDC